ncbi:dihydrofolate reductase family protein [Pseudomonas sp. ZM23]|uniref:Dihydrofolate reductase family protein n=1 Tax=Pseudomonas triclosanedens TaxID=2961893 RepID=A0ABY7A2Y2_9PSED|nr:dihydrofolate reductase family protein [Pseudomonas triclosanedens]MCP8464785.1 dihydrofolate reductase family protein [Pseudomonas triclosanedens]MCP8470502.1 dihydrofolate reductase family protein [Pseudomonas triclosanedens]MCP8476308.1 dihydrofolate reductase family protein [Pseudomonas triclosanedens]WAI51463.1 dihydrofolate reductase family protein [Pseudomonas triclosanedens]
MPPVLIYYVAASLDGYIARPDGSVDWLQGYDGSGDDHGYDAFYASIDGLLMGRATYLQCLGFGAWPYPGKPTVVMTRSNHLPQAAPQVELLHCPPSEALETLLAKGCKRIWLVGGGSLAGNILAAGLLGEVIVSIIPHLLGAGIPLFSVGLEQRLQLLEQRSFPSGIVQMRYQVLKETPSP